ncbi:MAG: hypothetical protein CM15mP109_11090 [Candidatus Dadabacteria bacterium]|nr:MAG: hypothetical protein CM15mP109_11090 [Candidatus Dadabacteria bacterium]
MLYKGSDVTIALNENIALTSQPGGIEIDATALDGSTTADEVLTVTDNTTLIPVTIKSGGGSGALDGGNANDTIHGMMVQILLMVMKVLIVFQVVPVRYIYS